MSDWPDLLALVGDIDAQVDQRMSAAFHMCPSDRSIHDVHVLRALFRTNAVFVRHPYAEALHEAVRSMQYIGEDVHAHTGRSLRRT